MTNHEPIRRWPRAVRPPYDEPVPGGTNQADLLAALLEPLGGMEVTEVERSTLSWLANWEVPTVAVVAGLMWRCRENPPAARPLLTTTEDQR